VSGFVAGENSFSGVSAAGLRFPVGKKSLSPPFPYFALCFHGQNGSVFLDIPLSPPFRRLHLLGGERGCKWDKPPKRIL
jgi:hypothetical protein